MWVDLDAKHGIPAIIEISPVFHAPHPSLTTRCPVFGHTPVSNLWTNTFRRLYGVRGQMLDDRTSSRVQKMATDPIELWEIFVLILQENFPWVYGVCDHFLDMVWGLIVTVLVNFFFYFFATAKLDPQRDSKLGHDVCSKTGQHVARFGCEAWNTGDN